MKQKKRYSEIEELKNRIIDIALIIGSIVGLLVFISDILDYSETGINIFILIDCLVFLVFLSIYFFRKNINLYIKNYIFIACLFAYIITDMLIWGIFSSAKVLIITALFMAFLGFSVKRTIIVYIMLLISFVVLSYLHISETINRGIDFIAESKYIEIWVINFLLITIVSFVIILIIKLFNNKFLLLIRNLEENNRYIIERENNYSKIFNATSDAIFIHDLRGKILEVNDSMLHMYKYSKEEISTLDIGKLSEGVDPYDNEHAEMYIQEAITKGNKVFDWKAKDKKGKVFWTEVTLKKIKIKGEDRVLAVVKNIDEKKRIAIELEESGKNLEKLVKIRTEELEVINEELRSNNEELLNLNENIDYQKNIIELKERRLNSIIHNQGEGFSINALNDRFIMANPKAHEILGVPEGELTGMHLKEFFDDNEWETIVEQTKLRKKNISSTYEVKIKLKNGLKKHLIITGTPDYDENGNIVGTIANFRDITERINREKKLKELNEELNTSNEELNEANEELLNLNENIQYQKNLIEEKENRLNTIINNQGEGLIIADLDENFVFASSSAHYIFEVPKGNLIGRSLKEFVDDNDRSKISKQTKQSRENKRSTYEVKIRVKNGSEKYLIITNSPDYDETGNVIGTIANIRNITDRIIKEKKLRELNIEMEVTNEELYEANEELSAQKDEIENTLDKLKKTQNQLVHSEKMASLGVLSAGVAHEINNPLNYIQGGITGLENICKTHFDSDKKNIKPLIDAIKEGVERASKIVTGLNHFSRQDDSDTDECDIHSIIENCITILQNKLKFRIDLIRNYHDSKIIIEGNEGKLHQVFINILSNAEQSIKDTGTVSITTKIIDKFAIITFEDTGEGIKEEHLHKITDPFFTTKDPGKGTGLGLSIVHRIIEEHNGNIKFKSKIGTGTKVEIKLNTN